MHQREPKSAAVYLRVTPDVKRELFRVASRYGEPSDVIREILVAFIEGRVTVSPPSNPKESLYNVT